MISGNNGSKYKRRRFLAIGIIIFLLINIIALGTFMLIHLASRAPLQREIADKDRAVQTMLIRMINTRIDTVIADLLHLTDLLTQDVNGDELISGSAEKDKIISTWISLSNRKIYYDKIRFMDMQGMERIRVNYSRDGAYSVNADELQFKGDRYFFQEAAFLADDQVYMSSADLNMDFDIVEEPIVPTLRFAAPVFSDNGEKIGIIMINYELTELLGAFKQIAGSSDSFTYWLNQESYYLYNQKDPDRAWGFMFSDNSDESLAHDNQEIWLTINRTYESYLTDSSGVFISNWFRRDSYYPGGNHSESSLLTGNDRWLVVSEINRANDSWYAFEQNPGQILLYVFNDQREVLLIVFLISLVFLMIWNINTVNRSKLELYLYDHLTGSLVRHSGLEKLQGQLKTAENEVIDITICFLDINGLKEVNDTFGHECGDELIRLVADTVRAEVRHSDYLIRMGGDEFLIVFYDSDLKKAEQIWQRIKESIDNLNQQTEGSSECKPEISSATARRPVSNDSSGMKFTRPYIISVSHGFRQLQPGSDYDIDRAIKDADSLMYEEKSRIKETLNVIR